MVSKSERLILAAFISLTSFCFSFYWYKTGARKFHGVTDEKPIAKLEKSGSSVQRKPVKRVIWQKISPGDYLYSKEAIRTPSDASAEIVFLEEKTKIELDPDSVIVLEKGTGDISLNFLKGNVSVSGGGGGGKLKIKSGDSVIESTSGDLNLSNQNGKGLELQVLSGNAKLNANGKSVEIGKNQIGKVSSEGLEIEKDLLEILAPLTNEKVYLDTDHKENMNIVWKKVAGDYDYELFTGRSPGRLKKSESAELKENGKLEVKFRPGLIYWQLQAVPKDPAQKTLKSAVFKNHIVPIRPPVFVEPQNGQQVTLKGEDKGFEFRWANPMDVANLQFQVWRTKDGQMVKGSEKTAVMTDNRSLHEFTEPGSYSARLTGFLKMNDGKTRPISSEIVNFAVRLSKELEPPVLRSPLADQRIRYTRAVEAGLFVSWEPVPGSKGYKLAIETTENGKPKKQEHSLEEPIYRFSKFGPGDYHWKVATVGANGAISAFSERRGFTVTDVPILAWGPESEQGASYYLGEDPQLNLSWESASATGSSEVKKWQVLYSPQGQWEKARAVEAGGQKLLHDVPKEGLYEAQAQGLDENGEVIAQTSRKTFKVQPRPFLQAPKFDPSLDDDLEANAKGDVGLFWKDVEGAAAYLIRLEKEGDKGGKVKELRTADPELTIKSLKPGVYKAQVFAVDQYSRLSKDGDERKIRVKNQSDIRAPATFKKMKVKGVYKKNQ